MNLYDKIKKEHLFIFIVILVALVIFSYFDLGYTGLAVRDTCYGEGYSCCSLGTGQDDYYFSLDDTCNTGEQCWSSCKIDENLITTRVTLVEAVQELYNKIKNLFTRPVGEPTVCIGNLRYTSCGQIKDSNICVSTRVSGGFCQWEPEFAGGICTGGAISPCNQQSQNTCTQLGCELTQEETGPPTDLTPTEAMCGGTPSCSGKSFNDCLRYSGICEWFTELGSGACKPTNRGCSAATTQATCEYYDCTWQGAQTKYNLFVGVEFGTGTGKLISSPAGIDCKPDCSEQYVVGTEVTLTASPNANSVFAKWSGECSAYGAQTTCTLIVDKAKGVDAIFNLKETQPEITQVSCSTGQKIGDVSGEGQITSYDASLAQQIVDKIISPPTDICCVDINNDKSITSTDASQILGIVAGQLQSPGTCSQLPPTAEAPNAPYNLVATTLSQIQIRLSWRYEPSNELGFKIERSQTSSTNGFTEIGTVPKTSIVYQDVGLTPNTQYWYRVRAYNDAGNSDYSNTVTATTSEEVTPNPPTNLKVELVNNQIQLTWDVSSSIITGGAVLDNQITGNTIRDVFDNILDFFKRLFRGEIVGVELGEGYKIYRVDDQNQKTEIPLLEEEAEKNCTSSKCTYIDRNVVRGQGRTYSYEVSAFSRTSESTKTNKVSISPPEQLSIIINDNAQTTNSRNVNLKLSAKNAYQCRYSNSEQQLESTNYEDYATTKTWELTSIVGAKTVYYQCRNLLGASKISASIELVSAVTCAPGSTQSGTCLVCNAQGTAYIQDDSKCSSGQICSSNGQCLPSTISCSAGQKIGDANNDTIINNIDEEIVLNIVVGIIPEPNNKCCVDVSKDGKISAFDTSLITQIVAGTYNVEEPRVCTEALQKEICNNDKDDDDDGIIDGLDRDCALGAKVTLDRVDVLDNEPFEESEVTLECTYSATGPTATTGRAAPCISGKINDVDCDFEDRSNNVITYTCDTGAKQEEVEIGCYISQDCNTDTLDNKKTLLIDVIRPALCSEVIGEDILEIVSQKINDDEFKIGEVIESDLRIRNDDVDNKDIVVEALLYDLKSKDLIEEATQTKEIRGGRSENFELKITIPTVTKSIFKMYYQIYEQDNEDEFCIESSEKLEIKGLSGDICDKDNDGYEDVDCGGNDCNDNDNLINPLAVEICTDLVDNDCDNLVDSNDLDCQTTQCQDGEVRDCGTNIGICQKGTQTCNNGAWGNCVGAILPSNEICTDSLDNDCDSFTDSSDTDCVAEVTGDSDNDGLLDSWELEHFGNLLQSGDDDFDGDGFTNLEEFGGNTDPTNPEDKPKKASILVPVLIVLGVLVVAFVLVWLFALRPKKPKVTELKFKPDQISKPVPAKQVNPALRQYIRNSLKKGFSKQQIKNALLLKGWTEREIEEAFKYK